MPVCDVSFSWKPSIQRSMQINPPTTLDGAQTAMMLVLHKMLHIDVQFTLWWLHCEVWLAKQRLLLGWELGQSRDERVFSDVIREQEPETDFQIDLTQHLCFQSGNPLLNAHLNCVEKKLTHFFLACRDYEESLFYCVDVCRVEIAGKGRKEEKLNKSPPTVICDVKLAATHPPFLHKTAILSDLGHSSNCLQTEFSDCLSWMKIKQGCYNTKYICLLTI